MFYADGTPWTERHSCVHQCVRVRLCVLNDTTQTRMVKGQNEAEISEKNL